MSNSQDTRGHTRSPGGGQRRGSRELAQPGDWVEVEGTRGAGPRRGEILAVLGLPGHTHFRVRWDEKHESLLYPAEGGCIVHARRPRGSGQRSSDEARPALDVPVDPAAGPRTPA